MTSACVRSALAGAALLLAFPAAASGDTLVTAASDGFELVDRATNRDIRHVSRAETVLIVETGDGGVDVIAGDTNLLLEHLTSAGDQPTTLRAGDVEIVQHIDGTYDLPTAAAAATPAPSRVEGAEPAIVTYSTGPIISRRRDRDRAFPRRVGALEFPRDADDGADRHDDDDRRAEAPRQRARPDHMASKVVILPLPPPPANTQHEAP